MLELVKVDYLGQPLSFSEDEWFNATVAAERFGKRPNDWLLLEETKQYVEALAFILNTIQDGILNASQERISNTRKVGSKWRRMDL